MAFELAQGGGDGFWLVASTPGLVDLVLRLLDGDVLRSEGHPEGSEVKPMLGARQAIFLGETIIEWRRWIGRQKAEDGQPRRPRRPTVPER